MKKKKRLVVLFCMVLVILFIIIYVVPNVTGALKSTEIIEYGSIQVTDQVTAFFVRNESVYFANKSGTINYYVAEGEQVRKGVQILDIASGGQKDEKSRYEEITERILNFNGGESLFTDDLKKINAQILELETEKNAALSENEPEKAARLDIEIQRINQKKNYILASDSEARKKVISQNLMANGTGTMPDSYISSSNGVISYYIDGYETEFTPENMELLSRDKVQNLNIEVLNVVRETTLAKEPLFKVVDNKEWYAIFWVASENIVKYEKDHRATIKLPQGEVAGTIYDIIDDDGKWLVILKFNKYYEKFDQIRKIDAEVITSNYSGLIIENESITTENGQPGVYVKDKNGEYVFKPVEIITSDGESSLVEVSYYYTDNGATKVETVNIYDEILKKPN